MVIVVSIKIRRKKLPVYCFFLFFVISGLCQCWGGLGPCSKQVALSALVTVSFSPPCSPSDVSIHKGLQQKITKSELYKNEDGIISKGRAE